MTSSKELKSDEEFPLSLKERANRAIDDWEMLGFLVEGGELPVVVEETLGKYGLTSRAGREVTLDETEKRIKVIKVKETEVKRKEEEDDRLDKWLVPLPLRFFLKILR